MVKFKKHAALRRRSKSTTEMMINEFKEPTQRSKRSRKRPRGGIGCLAGDGAYQDKTSSEASSCHSLRAEVIPLSDAFDLFADIDKKNIVDNRSCCINDERFQKVTRKIRIIHPYPYTFATFAKERWTGRTLLDVYHQEFGSYPRSYYEAAIKAGRILVSGQRVDCTYVIQPRDELTHTVHRHEPAVGLSDNLKLDNSSFKSHTQETLPVDVVHEDDNILVIDKPSTLPIHPCGAYNYNSLTELLAHYNPLCYGSGKLFTIYRLDRLTSGLVLMAKNVELAKSLGKCILHRKCEKIYLAKVKGRFPFNMIQAKPPDDEKQSETIHAWRFELRPSSSQGVSEKKSTFSDRPLCMSCIPPPCMEGEFTDSYQKFWSGGIEVPYPTKDISQSINKGTSILNKSDSGQQRIAPLGYWMTDQHGSIVPDTSLQQLYQQTVTMTAEEILASATNNRNADKNITFVAESQNSKSATSILWMNFACPCRVESHKNSICEAGDFSHLTDGNDRKGIKPAQTSFTLLSFDAVSDTSVVLAKPVTGRTHQIRLHLQKIGHPIANDHCYGGEIWFGDQRGNELCTKSREWLDNLDGVRMTTNHDDDNENTGEGKNDCSLLSRARVSTTLTNVPATDEEINYAAANRAREGNESILDFIEKTCVWCARCHRLTECLKNSKQSDATSTKKGLETAVLQRTLMEYLVRSQGIWLHALQYSLQITDNYGKATALTYRTKIPHWAHNESL